MPHKFNADRRAKIPKQKRRVTNCAEYDERDCSKSGGFALVASEK
jgi:hypothetical protein